MKELKMEASDSPAYRKYWRAYFRRMAHNLLKPPTKKQLADYQKKAPQEYKDCGI